MTLTSGSATTLLLNINPLQRPQAVFPLEQVTGDLAITAFSYTLNGNFVPVVTVTYSAAGTRDVLVAVAYKS